MTTLTDEVLLEDPRFYIEQDPHPIYARLRREAPVFRYENDGIAFWALSKWADLRAVSVDSDTFSSAKGIMVTDPREMRDLGHDVNYGLMPEDSQNMIITDPPIHTYLRNVVCKVFTPRMVKKIEGAIREIAIESVESVEPARRSTLSRRSACHCLCTSWANVYA